MISLVVALASVSALSAVSNSMPRSISTTMCEICTAADAGVRDRSDATLTDSPLSRRMPSSSSPFSPVWKSKFYGVFC